MLQWAKVLSENSAAVCGVAQGRLCARNIAHNPTHQVVILPASRDDVDADPDERHVHTSGLIWD